MGKGVDTICCSYLGGDCPTTCRLGFGPGRDILIIFNKRLEAILVECKLEKCPKVTGCHQSDFYIFVVSVT